MRKLLAWPLLVCALVACSQKTETESTTSATTAGKLTVATTTSTPADAAKTTDSNGPCALLTPAEAQAAIGKPVLKAHAVSGATCNYEDANDIVFAVTLKTSGAKQDFGPNAAAPSAETVSGIGDEAKWGPFHMYLFVRSADKELTVGPGSLSPDQFQAIASKIVPRI